MDNLFQMPFGKPQHLGGEGPVDAGVRADASGENQKRER